MGGKGTGFGWLTVLTALALLVADGRVSLWFQGDPAVFVEPLKIWVELGRGFVIQGVVQIHDGSLIRGVKNMATDECRTISSEGIGWDSRMMTGAKYHLDVNTMEVCTLQQEWMGAGRRIALGIPLHVERMNRTDWEFLPGIGPERARKIETERQNNGEFSGIDDLKRVRGIGDKTIQLLKPYFGKN